MRLSGRINPARKDLIFTWLSAFLFAGSSAFLLLLAAAVPQYWYVSFISLTPFLYRILKASPIEGLRTGLLFGLTLTATGISGRLVSEPVTCTVIISAGVASFTFFGWITARVQHACGFRPWMVAALWVTSELFMVRLGFAFGFLGLVQFGDPFIHGAGILFGSLLVAAAVVYLNTIIALVIDRAAALTESGDDPTSEGENQSYLFSPRPYIAQRYGILPDSRSPPHAHVSARIRC